MKGYSNYKESDVNWIGSIPNHWGNVRLKQISSITKGRKPNKDFRDKMEGLLPYLSMEYLRDKTDEPIYAEVNEKNIVIVEEGDILILWDGSKAGEIVRAKNGILSSTMAKIEIYDDRFESNFLNYLLQLGEKHIQANTIGMGIPHVNGNILKDLMMLLPPFEEQTKIASFLDYKTNLIDATIEKKKRLIELLKEKRQAVINEAVTKGLNPNAPMKDSGVEWLGEIPEHWEVAPLRYLYHKIGSGVTPKGGGDVYVDQGIIFIRSQNVHFDGLRLDDVVKIDVETHQKMSNSQVRINDVLLNITGASIGRCCVANIDQEMNVNQHVCIIRVNEKIIPNYLNVVLQSNVGQIQIKVLTTGGNREGLTHEAVKNMLIPLPNIEQQKELLGSISTKLSTYDLINSKILFQIEKLQTYRQCLISEAATGKIDVRDWQPTTNK